MPVRRIRKYLRKTGLRPPHSGVRFALSAHRGAYTHLFQRVLMSLAEKEKRRGARKKSAPVMRAIAALSKRPGDLPAPFRMPKIRRPVFPDRVVDIRAHGA